MLPVEHQLLSGETIERAARVAGLPSSTLVQPPCTHELRMKARQFVAASHRLFAEVPTQ